MVLGSIISLVNYRGVGMHFKGQVTPASILEELVLYAQAEPEETEGFCHPSHNN